VPRQLRDRVSRFASAQTCLSNHIRRGIPSSSSDRAAINCEPRQDSCSQSG
jgi:hypothetical protein